MKKQVIGALVGGFILFMWQFLSWSMLNVHGSNLQYTPEQDKVLESLSILPEGSYLIPNIAPENKTAEAEEAYRATRTGKPWALVSYHKSMTDDMGMNMFRGYLIDFLAVLFLIYLLLGRQDLTFGRVLISSILVGLIGYLTISYLNSIWFKSNSIPDLIDAVVQWGLCGTWLGWWLLRK